jgi:hypothetical protein
MKVLGKSITAANFGKKMTSYSLGSINSFKESNSFCKTSILFSISAMYKSVYSFVIKLRMTLSIIELILLLILLTFSFASTIAKTGYGKYEQNIDICGIEISEEMLGKAREKYPNILWYQEDAKKLSMKNIKVKFDCCLIF